MLGKKWLWDPIQKVLMNKTKVTIVNQLLLYIIPLILTRTSGTRAVPVAPLFHSLTHLALVPVSSAAAQHPVRMCENKMEQSTCTFILLWRWHHSVLCIPETPLNKQPCIQQIWENISYLYKTLSSLTDHFHKSSPKMTACHQDQNYIFKVALKE